MVPEPASVPQQPTRVLSCASCSREIHDNYYGVLGRIACEQCHGAAVMDRSQTSAVVRFLRAAAYGAVAGGAGAAIWYVVRAVTGYEHVLYSFALGPFVGWAVRAGSRRQRTWPFAILAMAVTYVAIASTYIPLMARAARLADARASGPVTTPVSASNPLPSEDVRETRDPAAFRIRVALVALVLPIFTLFSHPAIFVIVMTAVVMAGAAARVPPPALEGPFPVNIDTSA